MTRLPLAVFLAVAACGQVVTAPERPSAGDYFYWSPKGDVVKVTPKPCSEAMTGELCIADQVGSKVRPPRTPLNENIRSAGTNNGTLCPIDGLDSEDIGNIVYGKESSRGRETETHLELKDGRRLMACPKGHLWWRKVTQ